jgi:hypothetical protein
MSHFLNTVTCHISLSQQLNDKQSKAVDHRCVVIHTYTPKQAHQKPEEKAPTDEGGTRNKELQTHCFGNNIFSCYLNRNMFT